MYLSNQEGSAFDFGELEEAIVLHGVKIRNDEAKARMISSSLSIIHLSFVTFDKHNQLPKSTEREKKKRERERKKERFLILSKEGYSRELTISNRVMILKQET